MHSTLLTATLLLVAAPSAMAQSYEQCRHEAQRTANVDAAGASLLTVTAGAGSLRIEGKAGLDRVVIRGRACASDARLLEEIELRADRRGSDVVVEAISRVEGWSLTGMRYASLDLVIEVPARMAAEITDGSGSIDISNLGAVSITDGSGEIIGNDLHGNVQIKDGSGAIKLTNLAGAVTIHDGSGSIELRDIGGLIDITDGSGEIDVRTARSSIRISDGSGGIEVADVDGDFTVTRARSGGIGYSNVKGRVDIPNRRVRRREAL
ncbi:MAG: hypothetical protein ACSLFE_02680 [Gemmatimonadaceae bacterium]